MNANSRTKLLLRHLTCAAMCLALCLYLPFLTGQIPQIGRALSPMHIPVLLAGFLCGPWWAMVVGLVAPMLRHSLFLMPPLVTAIDMSFELAAYGALAGVCYSRWHGGVKGVYLSLLAALVGGRLVWGLVSIPIYGLLTEQAFTLAAFWMGGFVNAWPGIVLQIVLIPAIVLALEKAKLKETDLDAAFVGDLLNQCIGSFLASMHAK